MNFKSNPCHIPSQIDLYILSCAIQEICNVSTLIQEWMKRLYPGIKRSALKQIHDRDPSYKGQETG